MKPISFLLSALTATLALTSVAPAQAVAAFVLDRSGSMSILRGTGNTRGVDSVLAATSDITNFFFWNNWLNNNPQALIYEFHGSTVTQLGGVHTTAASAIDFLTLANGMPSPSGLTPLAHALCTATTDLVNLNTVLTPGQRSLYLYSDGLENSSPSTSCISNGNGGVLPSATTGNRCAGQFGSSPAFNSGSWQDAVCTIIQGQILLNVYYFGALTDLVGPGELFTALTDLTGGTLYSLTDPSTAPVANPWRLFGQGCQDFNTYRPTMRHSGVPQLGETVGIGCRTSAPWPYLLAVGFSNTVGGAPFAFNLAPLGAPGCYLYSSSDLVQGPYAHDSLANIAIPTATSLVGAQLSFQGVHMHLLNNPLGIVTSNMLEMTILP